MSLCISDHNPSLTLGTPLANYCQNFLHKHGLNYFQVIRVNFDGSTVVLTNKPNFTRFAIENAIKMNVPLVYSCIKQEFINAASYFFLWEPNLPVQTLAMVRNQFNISNGLTFVERYPTHYYMFAFAAPADNPNVLDFYLNNIDLLRRYIQDFKEQRHDLLLKLESQPLHLSKALQDQNLAKMILNPQKKLKKQISVLYQGCQSYMTFQEYQCVKQLPLGLSSKQIGQLLKLSPRTVEQYFERVKIRTGCKTKRDLIQLLA